MVGVQTICGILREMRDHHLSCPICHTCTISTQSTLICKHYWRNLSFLLVFLLPPLEIDWTENCTICWTCLDTSFLMPLTLLLSSLSLPLWRVNVAIVAIVAFQHCHRFHCDVPMLLLLPWLALWIVNVAPVAGKWCTC